MTIEQTQRRFGADILRQFIAGEITNEQFHRNFPRSTSDAALNAIFRGAWVTYSDLREYRLVGKDTPSEMVRAILERCRLFLTTDLPFEWPEPKISMLAGILNLLSFGSISRRSEARLGKLGEVDYWPFIRKSDYTAALRQERDCGRQNILDNKSFNS
jgi:hypothetical protein